MGLSTRQTNHHQTIPLVQSQTRPTSHHQPSSSLVHHLFWQRNGGSFQQVNLTDNQNFHLIAFESVSVGDTLTFYVESESSEGMSLKSETVSWVVSRDTPQPSPSFPPGSTTSSSQSDPEMAAAGGIVVGMWLICFIMMFTLLQTF